MYEFDTNAIEDPDYLISEQDAIKFANSAATLKCKFFGGRDGFPNRQQVDQFLMEYK